MNSGTSVRATLNRSVILGIGLLIAFLGAGAVVSYRNIQSLRETARLISHTHEVDQLATQLLSLATDAVVSQRGYLLSGDEKFLLTCQDSIRELAPRINEVLNKTSDNDSQQERLTDLRRELEALQAELERGIQLRQNGRLEESEAVAATLAATKLLSMVRERVIALRNEERLLLIEREDYAGSALGSALWSAVLLFGLGLAVFVGIVELIRRNTLMLNQQRERLFAEREQLGVTLASITEAVISVDRTGRVTQWNGAAEQMTGRPKHQALGIALSEVLRLTDEVSREALELPVAAVLNQQKSEQVDMLCLLADSTSRELPVLIRMLPLRDKEQSIIGLVLVMRELAEERLAESLRLQRARILLLRADVGMIIARAGRTEEQLLQSVTIIREQLGVLAVGLWTVGDVDNSLKLTASCTQPGWSLTDRAPDEQACSVIGKAAALRTTINQPATPHDSELQAAADVRASVAVSIWGCPLLIEDRLLGVLSVYSSPAPGYASPALSDLCATELQLVSAKLSQFIERRAIEQARQASEELFRNLANSIPQLAWMARPDGYVFWYNQRWYDYTGTTLEEMQGWGWQAVHDPTELPHVLETLRHSFASGDPWELTFPLRRHDGEFRWHLTRMLPVHDQQGRIQLWFGTNTDVTEQRNAEVRLRRVIDSMFAFVGILSADGTLIEVNQAPLTAADISRDSVVGQKFWDCRWWSHSPAVQDRLRMAFARAVSGNLVRYDEEIQIRGGELITIDIMLQPVFDEGRLIFVIPSGVDITSRKQAEESLAASETFLLSVLDALTSHIAVLDNQGMILMVNEAWRQFADQNHLESSNYAIGHNYLEVTAPVMEECQTDAASATDGIRAVVEGRLPAFAIEYPCHSPTEKRWFQMRASSFTCFDSLRVVVSHEDITSRVLSEEATRSWSAQQQSLAEMALQLSVAQDLETTLEVVTTGARQLIASQAAETIRLSGDDWHLAQRAISCCEGHDPLPPLSESHQTLRNQVRSSNRPLRLAARTADAEGDSAGDAWLRYDCLAAPLTDREGRNIGLILLHEKLTGTYSSNDEAILVQIAQMASVALERARLYEEIRNADQRKDQFLATLAHELRNPLSALTSGTHLIAMAPENQVQVAETAELISSQCLHLKQLVDDLLDVSRISQGKLKLQFAPVKMQAVVHQAVAAARPKIDAARHALKLDIADQPLLVQGDEIRLTQVLTNLLVNACKYTPDGGQIELKLAGDETHVTVIVRDNGVGIPPEMLEQIFDLFAQIDSSHTRSQGGLGIGLTLARTLVGLHRGEIEVASPGQDQGSTFTVKLPRAANTVKEVPVSPPLSKKPADLPRRKILVVDDNHAAIYLLSQLLTSLGQEVQIAKSGLEALNGFSHFQPDLVISDIGMPDMSGYDLARHIRDLVEISQPVLVALTGYGQATDREAAYAAGFDQHLVKPVSLGDLVKLLTELARKGQA